MSRNTSRRQFIRVGIGAGILTAGCTKILPSLENADWADKTALANEIPKRVLGKTGEKLPMIGVGGVQVGGLPDENRALRMVDKAMDMGVTFLDTAYIYSDGRSEQRLGKALKGKRDRVFLMSKTMGRTAEDARKQLEGSLVRLQTDYLDLWQFHDLRTMDDVKRTFGPGGAYEAAAKAKEEGKVRYIGFTGHLNPEIHLEALKHHELIDTVQMPINVVDPHYRSFIKDVLPRLEEHNIGVLAMKTLAAANIARKGIAPVPDALRYVWSQAVHVLISGTMNEEQMEMNINLARAFKPMGTAEQKELIASTLPHGGVTTETYKGDEA